MCKKTKKKNKEINKNEILVTHTSEMAGAIFFKFGIRGGISGGHLCSETGSNRTRDHGTTKV